MLLFKNMSLKITISGIRGIIGETPGLNPQVVVNYTAAYCHWLKSNPNTVHPTIYVGFDGRKTGPMYSQLVQQTIISMGFDVCNLGLTTTPTIAYTVLKNKGLAAIIITASHNPQEWNALKLLNHAGEFIAEDTVQELKKFVETNQTFSFVAYNKLGQIKEDFSAIQQHILGIVQLQAVNINKIRQRKFKIIVDVINSSGAIAVPKLLEALGVQHFDILNAEIKGVFNHDPEPTEKNLTALIETLKTGKYDVGIAVDPDVDRICFVQEDGSFFGEEYSLVAIADYYLNVVKGPVVNNLSSTMALHDIANQHKVAYHSSAVGERWVVQKMKETNSPIGGEGNGGIIVSELHYGRDALVGIALFLSYLASENVSCSDLRNKFPKYPMTKTKIELTNMSKNFQLKDAISFFKNLPDLIDINDLDGLKLFFKNGWVHIRESNTEPILRIISEAKDQEFLSNYISQVSTIFNNFNQLTYEPS